MDYDFKKLADSSSEWKRPLTFNTRWWNMTSWERIADAKGLRIISQNALLSSFVTRPALLTDRILNFGRGNDFRVFTLRCCPWHCCGDLQGQICWPLFRFICKRLRNVAEIFLPLISNLSARPKTYPPFEVCVAMCNVQLCFCFKTADGEIFL